MKYFELAFQNCFHIKWRDISVNKGTDGTHTGCEVGGTYKADLTKKKGDV